MSAETVRWSRRYQTALRKHLDPGPGPNLGLATKLGRQAAALGLETLDLARIHEHVLMTAVSRNGPSKGRRKPIARLKRFFAESIVPIERTHSAAVKADARVSRRTKTLRRRTVESSASTRCLKRTILLRRRAEQALKKSGRRHIRLLAGLRRLQKRLRHLTHTCLSAQEDERQKMSCRLHDDIGQALIAIDLRLLALKKAASDGTAGLKKEIAKSQRLVKDSTERVDRFVHEFGIRHDR